MRKDRLVPSLTHRCRAQIRNATKIIYGGPVVIDIHTRDEMDAVRKFLQTSLKCTIDRQWRWYKTYVDSHMSVPRSYLRVMVQSWPHGLSAYRVGSRSWYWGRLGVRAIRAEVQQSNFIDE